jgi:hypothetical protein
MQEEIEESVESGLHHVIERFIDSLAKTYERIDSVACKAKGKKIYFHKIRQPNSFNIRNMVRL